MSVHHFDTRVAKKVGLNAAVIAYSIQYWCTHKAANEKDIHDGKAWVYNSMKAWSELLPYLSEKQIRTALKKLEDAGIIEVRNLNEKQYDQTRWYAYIGLQTVVTVANRPNGQMELPEKANGIAPEGKSNCPEGQTNTNNKPNQIPNQIPNDKPSASRADDISRVFEHYNRTAKSSGWVVCKKLTDAHQRNISGRIRDYSADDVCAFIDYLARLRWTSKGFENNRSFRASLGYVMRPRTFTEHFDKMPSRGLNITEQPQNRTDPLAQCFETYAKTGEWFGDRHGWVLKPEHPKADYPRELYARFGLTKEIAA